MIITDKQLAEALGCPFLRAARWVNWINEAMAKYEINTPLRIAHFIAQIGHESGRLIYVREIASGKAYEGRKDLGNINPGDGVLYKGRGLIQITGRTNYRGLGGALGVDLINSPSLLEQPQYAALSAGWYWSTRRLNQSADKDMLIAITKKINGGTNGIDDRRALLMSAKKALKI
jgi:putative chitinase